MKRLTLITIMLLFLLVMVATVTAANHSIQFYGKIDNYPLSALQTWLYHVKSNGSPAISHVEFITSCPCSYVAHAGTWTGDIIQPELTGGGGDVIIEERDGACIIKWDKGMSEAEYRDIYITMKGIYSETTSKWLIKAGHPDNTLTLFLPGAQCSTNSVDLLLMRVQSMTPTVGIALSVILLCSFLLLIVVWIAHIRNKD